MIKLLRFIFYGIIIRFAILIGLGLNIRHRERLPESGPCILVANHNSHLDTLVLMSLLPLRLLSKIQPVAAMDYFLKTATRAWFAKNIIGILPLKRRPDVRGEDVLVPVYEALADDKILIFFPEGTRGEPEELSGYKNGIARIASKYPDIPVIPILLHGLGKSLPKGSILPVPFFCDVFIGESLVWAGDKNQYMQDLDDVMHELSDEGKFPIWE